MTVTRTRISGNYIRPTGSSFGGNPTTRTRVSGNYIKPAGPSFFGRNVTRTPVYSNSWFNNPFRSSWYSPVRPIPVYSTPLYSTPYTVTPIMPVPVDRNSSLIADVIIATVIIAGIVALVATPWFSQKECYLEKVCASFGCGIDEVCKPLNSFI